MNKEITDEQLIGFIEGETNEELQQMIESDESLQKRVNELQELLTIIEASEEVEVPSHISANFQTALIHEEMKQQKSSFSWMQIAASIAILLLGFSLGTWSSGTNGSSEELAQLRNEVQSLREVTLKSTLQRHSASERIMAVNQIDETTHVNQDLLATLLATLNSDESPNVRYAALQALRRYINDENVKAELVKSLERQSDPLIQISLITILVEAEEHSVIAPLREILKNEEITPEVKQQAAIAIKVLT